MAMTGLMDKIGVSTFEFDPRGKNAGLNFSRAWDQREQDLMLAMAQHIYDNFTDRVGQSRKGKIKDIADVAQGRVFTARQAAANGLIDKVGGLREAMSEAQKQAKLGEHYYIISLPRQKTLANLLGGTADDDDGASAPRLPGLAGGDIESAMLKRLTSAAGPTAALSHLMNMVQMLNQENVLAVVPYYFSIKD